MNKHRWILLSLLIGLHACGDSTNELSSSGENDANATTDNPATDFNELSDDTKTFFSPIIAKPSESIRFNVIAFTFLSTDYIAVKNLELVHFQPDTQGAETVTVVYRFSSFTATVKLTDTLKCGRFSLAEFHILLCPTSENIEASVFLGEKLISTFGEVIFSDAAGNILYNTLSKSDVLTSQEQFSQLTEATSTTDPQTIGSVESTYNDTQNNTQSFQEDLAPQIEAGTPLSTLSTTPSNPAPDPNTLVPWNPQTFAQRAYFKASNAEAGDWFGYGLAASGSTITAGALWEDSAASGINGDQSDNSLSASGAVYLFRKDDNGTWSQPAYIKASNPDSNDQFGSSVALAKNGTLLAVGARYEDSNAIGINGNQNNNSVIDSGAVYIFSQGGDGTWAQEAYLKASNTGSTGDAFGESLAFSEDGTLLAVGASWEDSNSTGVNGDQTNNNAYNSGAVYIFARANNGIWSQEAYLKASNTGSSDQFGRSVFLSQNRLIVGAPGEDSNATGVNGDQTNNGASNSGAAYIFARANDGAWSQEAYLKASNTEASDEFGSKVSIFNTLVVVGAGLEDSAATGINGDQTNNSASNSGAAYIFARSNNGTWLQEAYLKASNTQSIDIFGSSVAAFEDGIAVGASGEDSQSLGINGNQTNDPSLFANSGAAYIFRRQAGVWSQTLYVKSSNTGTFQPSMGEAIAISGGLMVASGVTENGSGVGVNGSQTDAGALDSGAGFVFE